MASPQTKPADPADKLVEASGPAARAAIHLANAQEQADAAAHIFVQDLKRIVEAAGELDQIKTLIPGSFLSTVKQIAKELQDQHLAVLEKALIAK